MSCKSFNQVEVSGKALRHNYRLLQERAGDGVRLLAMVKADGYGHGMCDAARAFQEAGCMDFGVAEIIEGIRLREAGIGGNILVFLGFDLSDAGLFFEHDLTPVIYDIESGVALSREAVRLGKDITVHLKVDCGMTRLGVLPDEIESVTARLNQLPGIKLGGLASHFPRADEPESSQTLLQFQVFNEAVEKVSPGTFFTDHTANSGGILYFPQTCCAMVRAGISLYGYYPDGVAGVEREAGEKLQPAMTLKTRVLQVKTVPAGTGVSYGHTYTTEQETRLAVLPVGYEDGVLRSLSNKGEVLVQGQRAPIRGRVCMNLCMVDVSEIEGVAAGDEVVILGTQAEESISADEIAGWMDTISYEVLCLFGNNNERTHTE